MTFLPPSRRALYWAVAVTLAVVGWDAPPAPAGSHATASASPPARLEKQASHVVRIALEEFDRLVKEGNVILIDVRPYHAYQRAHLPNAMSIPLEELEGALTRLSAANARIVLYCGGPAGKRSGRAADVLRERGFERVYCLDGGFEGWLASGRVVIVNPT
jgi:rhodanese-related sulfurtransferase